MCVIAICPTRRLTADEILDMHAANPHGIGVAWINPRDGLVEYTKGLDPTAAQRLIRRVPLPQVVHFRWASAGGTALDLTHPFPLSEAPPVGLVGAAPAVLFHNGHWGAWETALPLLRAAGVYVDPQEPWSDTRVMAALMVQRGHAAVAQLVGPTQRLAILSGDGTVTLYGDFVEHDGLRVSNRWWVRDAWEIEADAALSPPRKKPARRIAVKAAKAARKAERRKRAARAAAQAVMFPEAMVSRYFPRVPRPTWPSKGGRR